MSKAYVEVEAQSLGCKVRSVSMHEGDEFEITLFPELPRSDYDKYSGVCFKFPIAIKDGMILLNGKVAGKIKLEPSARFPQWGPKPCGIDWVITEPTCPCCGKK